MKLLNAIAVAAFIGTSLITAYPAGARPHRTDCWEIESGREAGAEVCVYPVGNNSVGVSWDNKYTNEGFISRGNCTTGKVIWRAADGFTGSQISKYTRSLCS